MFSISFKEIIVSSYSTIASAVAKFTLAAVTPVVFVSDFATEFEQATQLMPVIFIFSVLIICSSLLSLPPLIGGGRGMLSIKQSKIYIFHKK